MSTTFLTNDQQLTITAISAGEDHFLVKKEDLQTIVTQYNTIRAAMDQTPKPEDLLESVKKQKGFLSMTVFVRKDGLLEMPTRHGIFVSRPGLADRILFSGTNEPSDIAAARTSVKKAIESYSNDNIKFANDTELRALNDAPSIKPTELVTPLRKIQKSSTN